MNSCVFYDDETEKCNHLEIPCPFRDLAIIKENQALCWWATDYEKLELERSEMKTRYEIEHELDNLQTSKDDEYTNGWRTALSWALGHIEEEEEEEFDCSFCGEQDVNDSKNAR